MTHSAHRSRPTVARLEPRLAPAAGDLDPLFAGVGYLVPPVNPRDVVVTSNGQTDQTPLSPPPPPAPALVGGAPNGVARRLVPEGGRYAVGESRTLFDRTTAHLRTATADVNGDGFPDLIAGLGPGTMTVAVRQTTSPFDSHPRPTVDTEFGGVVRVIDGVTGEVLRHFVPFEDTFTGGVFVAAADLTGDGKAEVIVTPDRGGGPIVAVFDLTYHTTPSDAPRQVARFLGIDDIDFRGGARPAVGDVNSDGVADLVIAAGHLGGPRIAVFDGREVATAGAAITAPPKLLPDFFAFEAGLRNGAFVAVGDVTGDGKADVAFGGGPGGAPRVRLFDGGRLLTASKFTQLDDIGAAQVANFFAGNEASRGGVRLALRDMDDNGTADLVTGSGEGEPGRVRLYLAATLRGSTTPAANQELDPFGNDILTDGVYIG